MNSVTLYTYCDLTGLQNAVNILTICCSTFRVEMKHSDGRCNVGTHDPDNTMS